MNWDDLETYDYDDLMDMSVCPGDESWGTAHEMAEIFDDFGPSDDDED